MITWVIGLTVILFGSSAFAKNDSASTSGRQGKKKGQCVQPTPKYDGQGDKKGNNGHGNNEDGVDKSNPGQSKQGEDTNPDEDDEKKSGGNK